MSAHPADQHAAPPSSPPAAPLAERAFSWQEIHILSLALAEKLKASGRGWTRIIAVTRGGMVPACIIARELDIRLVDSISIESHAHQTRGDVHIRSQPDLHYNQIDTLVIDDLSDSGNTFKAIRALWPQATYACLFVKPEGQPQADYFVEHIAQNCWVYLPWESQEFPDHITRQIGAHLL